MSKLFLLAGGICSLVAIVGLVAPKLVLRWMPVEKRTRLKAFGIFILLAFLFGAIGQATMSPEEKQAQEVAQQARKVETEKKMAEAQAKDEIERAERAKAEAAKTQAEAESLRANMITAKSLWQEYNANEVAADNKFKGKTIMMTGIVSDIKKDIMDNPYIVMSMDAYGLAGVQCELKDGNKAASLKKGQKIQVVGKVSGFIMESVMVKDGVIVE